MKKECLNDLHHTQAHLWEMVEKKIKESGQQFSVEEYQRMLFVVDLAAKELVERKINICPE